MVFEAILSGRHLLDMGHLLEGASNAKFTPKEGAVRSFKDNAYTCIRSFMVLGMKFIMLVFDAVVFTWHSLFLQIQALLSLLQGSTSLQSGTPSTATTTATKITAAAPVSLSCGDEDMQAFRADSFVLGKIPECPPPLELC